VNGLQLVGYTADLEYLVFDDAVEGSTRHRVPIDEDLLATLREINELLGPGDARRGRAAGASKGRVIETAPAPPSPESAAEQDAPPSALAGVGVLQTLSAAAVSGPPNGNGPEPKPSRTAKSVLSPREIQALLRAGVPPRTVARQADTDEAWVVRWLAPIEAERRRVLEAVRAARVSKARLGPSGDLLGDAVEINLLAKGVQPTSDTVEWIVTRREGEPAWTVTLRYRSRGRAQRAVWRFDPERRELDPRGALAMELAWTRPRGAQQRAPEVAEEAPPAKRGRSTRSAQRTAKEGAAGKRSAVPKSGAPARRAGARQPAPAPPTEAKTDRAPRAPRRREPRS
jgi:hypothetical protein